MTTTALIELRRYRLQPGRREALLELFARELVHTQEAVGLQVLACFRDDNAPNDFVWLRGFASDDPDQRARALTAFYDGPAWAAHADAANATMVDSDDVLLLRPAWPDPSSVGRALDSLNGTVNLTTCLLERALTAAERATLVTELRADPSGLALVLTDGDVPNRFPRLPVREDEHAVVWLSAPRAKGLQEIRLTLLCTPSTSHLHVVTGARSFDVR